MLGNFVPATKQTNEIATMQCSVSKASVHQFYANILVFININQSIANSSLFPTSMYSGLQNSPPFADFST